MKQKLSWLIGIVISVAIVQSCSKDSEDQVAPPPPTCNTENMKYSANILPIITSNCYGCHDAATATAGVVLEGYAALKTRADNGDLVGVVSHASGYPAMPYNRAKLSDCDINKIKAWVQAGAPNN